MTEPLAPPARAVLAVAAALAACGPTPRGGAPPAAAAPAHDRLWAAAGLPAGLADVHVGMPYDELTRARPRSVAHRRKGQIEAFGADTVRYEFESGPWTGNGHPLHWRMPAAGGPLLYVGLAERWLPNDSTATALWRDRARGLRRLAGEGVLCLHVRGASGPRGGALLAVVPGASRRTDGGTGRPYESVVTVWLDSSLVERVDFGDGVRVQRRPPMLRALVGPSLHERLARDHATARVPCP